MFVGITNTPRDYGWGSRTAIADLLGTAPSGGPEAELWLGAHPGSPSRIVDPDAVSGATTLLDWIAADPGTTLGPLRAGLRDGDPVQLPFLLKVLAAAAPLSLQAHPTLDRARAGFAAENEAGIPLDAANRNYKDALHKPELIFAISERFEALCGFRPVAEVRELFTTLLRLDGQAPDPHPEALHGVLDRLVGSEPDALRDAFEFLSAGGPEVRDLVERVVLLASTTAPSTTAPSTTAPSTTEGGEADTRDTPDFAREFATVTLLADAYPADPGIVTSLLLNRVSLRRGEALYLPAGNIHAYLEGVGVELMAASDNVLRGGLTPKHVDVAELLDVLEFSPSPVPYLPPETPTAGIEVFRPDVPDFVLVRVALGGGTRTASYRIDGPAIAIGTAGQLTVVGRRQEASVARGQSFYITPDEGELLFEGEGELFLATTGRVATPDPV